MHKVSNNLGLNCEQWDNCLFKSQRLRLHRVIQIQWRVWDSYLSVKLLTQIEQFGAISAEFLRAVRQTHQKYGWILLRSFRNASALCSTWGPRIPTELQVNYVATLQKCKCLMFRAGPQKPNRNAGELFCDPSETQVLYVQRRGPEILQKSGCSML